MTVIGYFLPEALKINFEYTLSVDVFSIVAATVNVNSPAVPLMGSTEKKSPSSTSIVQSTSDEPFNVAEEPALLPNLA